MRAKMGKAGPLLVAVGALTIAGVFALDEYMQQHKARQQRTLRQEINTNLDRLDQLFDRKK